MKTEITLKFDSETGEFSFNAPVGNTPVCFMMLEMFRVRLTAMLVAQELAPEADKIQIVPANGMPTSLKPH